MALPKLLTRSATAFELSCSEKTVDRLCDLGHLKKVKPERGGVRITSASLRSYLAMLGADGDEEQEDDPFPIPELVERRRQRREQKRRQAEERQRRESAETTHDSEMEEDDD